MEVNSNNENIMDDIQKIAYEATQQSFSDLKFQLPRVAETLGCAVEDLKVFDYEYFPKEYMTTKYRDTAFKTDGGISGIPFVQQSRLQQPGDGVCGYGVVYYRSRLDPSLKYAIYCFNSAFGGVETYLIVPKGKLYLLQRYARTLNKQACEIKGAPILADGLLDEIIQHTVGFLLRAKEIEKYGVKIKRGIILDGPPGNGKTMACRYIQRLCSQHGIHWGIITASDIDEAFANKCLGALFRKHTVTFFDDIDISYLDRSKGNGKIACSLLTAMDGLTEGGHLVRIFTTNESVEDLDPAFTRPGRIDKCITIEKPNADMRLRLMETWPEEIKNAVSLIDLAKKTNGFSFAEVEAIRSFLVTNKILGDKTWNINVAFCEFEANRTETKRQKRGGFGFGAKKT